MTTLRNRFTGQRGQLVETLFPEGVPRLWCPALTHYAEGGQIDRARIRAHVRSMQPWVKGFLVPGSTGEGWEMDDAEILDLLEVFIEEIRDVNGHLLIGILKTNAEEAIKSIAGTLSWLKSRTGTDGSAESLAKSGICGFTVCPPSGRELTQETIQAALSKILALGVPTSLYQLPQVTENEMSPETLDALASRHPNFYLFKDTSGADRAAKAGFREAFLVRGAEGDYARQLAEGGGIYDGFLLSTANCFGKQLAQLIGGFSESSKTEAETFSRALSALWDALFPLAGQVGYGNAFTNINKAIDHYMANGPEAGDVAPPLLHSGKRLPHQLISAAGEELQRYALMPEKGYLRG